MSAVLVPGAAMVGRSVPRPRVLRLERSAGSRDAAYRHLMTVILRLDAASLGSQLRASRLERRLPQAA